MYIKQTYIFLFLIIVFACNNTSSNKVELQFSNQVIKIPTIDFAASNPGMIKMYNSDSGEHVMIYNHVSKILQISHFPSGELKLNIPLEFESEKRTKRFTGGTLIAKDSIFVTFYPPAIGMMDFKGNLIWEKKLPQANYRVSHIGNGSMIPLFMSNERIYGAQPFLMDHHRMTSSDIQDQQLVYSIGLTEEESAWHDVYYSTDYWENGKKLSYFSWSKREDYIYIAPFYDHEIQIFDTKTNQVVATREVKSSYVNRFNVVNDLPENEEKSVTETLEADQYETFIYDEYRDVFYRIFLPGYSIERDFEIDRLRLMERSRPLTGIMVLDSELNILAEHVFELYEVHSSDNFLVGKDGLYVSTNNMNCSDYSDDTMSYRLLQLIF
ncbi:DUF4221 family protein [Belliella pelovolcani]|uniref:DUF4221 family protein n=1 Tax=Belliella pelovolcani TaxID=529505 RepID=UPI00391AA595